LLFLEPRCIYFIPLQLPKNSAPRGCHEYSNGSFLCERSGIYAELSPFVAGDLNVMEFFFLVKYQSRKVIYVFRRKD